VTAKLLLSLLWLNVGCPKLRFYPFGTSIQRGDASGLVHATWVGGSVTENTFLTIRQLLGYDEEFDSFVLSFEVA
jgi:hypothetical protein